MLRIVLIVLLDIISLNIYSQSNSLREYKILVTLHNAQFKSLVLVDYKDRQNKYINGKNIAPFEWEFTLPDSIVANSESMLIIVPEKDTITNAYHQIRFFRKLKNKTNAFANIGVQNRVNYIEAKYRGKTLFEKENVSIFSNVIDSTIIGNLICDDFDLVIKDDNSDITIRSLEPNYCWFTSMGSKKPSYNDQLQSYVDLSKKYRDSKYLITYLALNLHKFKNRNDVKRIYQNFSTTPKDSKWSKKIEHYLSGYFENISLINLELRSPEPIVQDTLTYNLITFSASWCIPCIEEIPLLKNLYKDLGQRIHFTYISMDYEKDLKSFQNLIVKYNIPWRTLYAFKDLERVKDLYFVVGIPYSLLIYPNGNMEVLDIRNEQKRTKLYNLK